MPTVRTALIGCGKVGQIHAAGLRDLPESEFVAVCDSNADRAKGLPRNMACVPIPMWL